MSSSHPTFKKCTSTFALLKSSRLFHHVHDSILFARHHCAEYMLISSELFWTNLLLLFQVAVLAVTRFEGKVRNVTLQKFIDKVK